MGILIRIIIVWQEHCVSYWISFEPSLYVQQSHNNNNWLLKPLKNCSNFSRLEIASFSDKMLIQCTTRRRKSQLRKIPKVFLKIKYSWHMFSFYFYHCTIVNCLQMKTLKNNSSIILLLDLHFRYLLFTLTKIKITSCSGEQKSPENKSEWD